MKFTVAYKTALTSDTNWKLRILRLSIYYQPTILNLGFLIPLNFNNSLGQHTKLRKALTSNHNFIIKDTNQDQSKEEMHRMQSGRVLNTKLVKHHPPGISVHDDQSEKLTHTGVSRFYLHKYVWFNHWPCDWTQSLDSLPKGQEIRLVIHGSKPQHSNPMVGLSASWHYPQAHHGLPC